VQVSLGDVPQGSLAYKTIFAAGITLFALTFLLNSLGYRIKKNYEKRYA
jgi:phosphate transport system permease protein